MYYYLIAPAFFREFCRYACREIIINYLFFVPESHVYCYPRVLNSLRNGICKRRRRKQIRITEDEGKAKKRKNPGL